MTDFILENANGPGLRLGNFYCFSRNEKLSFLALQSKSGMHEVLSSPRNAASNK